MSMEGGGPETMIPAARAVRPVTHRTRARSRITLRPSGLETLSDDLLTDGALREADLLAAGYDDLLVVEQLLGDNGG
jgi:hypothetical protein